MIECRAEAVVAIDEIRAVRQSGGQQSGAQVCNWGGRLIKSVGRRRGFLTGCCGRGRFFLFPGSSGQVIEYVDVTTALLIKGRPQLPLLLLLRIRSQQPLRTNR